MKHRFFIRALVCLLVLALPFSAMAQCAALDLYNKAETENKILAATITFTPGPELAKTQAVADMSAATKIQLLKSPGGLGSLALLLNDEAVFSAQVRASEDGLYAQSNTIGADPLYFAWADLEKLFTSALANSGMSSEAIDSMLAQYQQAFAQGFKTGVNAVGAASADLSAEELEKQLVENTFGGDDSLLVWAKALQARTVVTEGEFAAAEHDAATQKIELTLTQDDIIAGLETSAMQAQLRKQLAVSEPSLTDAELDAKLADEMATLKEKLSAMTLSMPITAYKAGEVLVCAEAAASLDFTQIVTETVVSENAEVSTEVLADAAAQADDAAAETVTKVIPVHVDMPLHFDRLTTDAGVSIALSASASKDGAMKVRMELAADKSKEGKIDATMNVFENGSDKASGIATLAYTPAETGATADVTLTAANGTDSCSAVALSFAETKADDAVDYALSVSCGTSVGAIAADPSSLGGTLNVHVALQDTASAFDKVANATPDTSVKPLQMTAEERSTFMGSVTTTAMQTLYTLLGQLPSSVIDAMGPLFNGALQ